MSRSRKKSLIQGITTCESEKKDKRFANRAFRRRVKIKLSSDEEILPAIKEISNVWSFGKDGKIYYKKMSDKDLRK
jgi:hypothetical protein